MSNTENFGHKSYINIYNDILAALKNDKLDHQIALSTAKRLTDSIWNLHLVLGTGTEKPNNTIQAVKNIIEDRLKR